MTYSVRTGKASWQPSFSLRPVDTLVNPIFSGAARLKLNSVVSCRISTGPSVARMRRAEAAKCPSRILSSLILPLEKNR